MFNLGQILPTFYATSNTIALTLSQKTLIQCKYGGILTQ